MWLPSYFESADEWQYAPKGFYVTKDRGESWTHVPDVDGVNNFHRLMWWLSRQALAADKVDGGVFALMADDERFYVSTDGGETWDQAAHSPPCAERNDCHVVGQLRAMPGRAREMWASVGTDGLYRTVDLGASPWEKVPGIDEVRAFGFGAPLADGDRQRSSCTAAARAIPSAASGARATTAPRGRSSPGTRSACTPTSTASAVTPTYPGACTWALPATGSPSATTRTPADHLVIRTPHSGPKPAEPSSLFDSFWSTLAFGIDVEC